MRRSLDRRYPIQWALPALTPAVLIVAFAMPLTAQRARLQLVQENIVQVPHGVDVTGASLSPDGSVLFWSRDGQTVWSARNGSSRRLCPDVRVTPVAAAQTDSGHVEIVNGSTSEIIRVGLSGECEVRSRFGRANALKAAAYDPMASEWRALEIDTSGIAVIIADRGDGIELARLEGDVWRRIDTMHFRFTRQGLLLTSVRWPFAWRLLRFDGRVLASGQPFESDAVMTHGEDTSSVSQWRGLATYQTDEGFLQVVADPRSDARVFALYDNAGSTHTTTMVDISLGILDFELRSKRLLMLRRINGLELVTYRLQRISP